MNVGDLITDDRVSVRFLYSRSTEIWSRTKTIAKCPECGDDITEFVDY